MDSPDGYLQPMKRRTVNASLPHLEGRNSFYVDSSKDTQLLNFEILSFSLLASLNISLII